MFFEKDDKKVLMDFLSMPLDSTDAVFKKFRSLNGAIYHKGDGNKEGFVYVPGKREDRILLVAHADTNWDKSYQGRAVKHEVIFEDGNFKETKASVGIGVDDRGGCAMLYLLRKSGHSLLITDGELYGQVGANFLRSTDPQLFEEINSHCFAIQLGRRNAGEYKFYDLKVTKDFEEFIKDKTGYKNADAHGRTDISALCRDICGVNFSIGYYNGNFPDEYLNFNEWKKTLDTVKDIITPKCVRYPLVDKK
ncbi:MAG: hypothetical protein Q8882_03615 [Bacillota bacterium]|nr:hypothetical protein [Bacillota bacterium]